GLTLLNHAPTAGGAPCHLTLGSQGRAVLVANYSGGSIISYRLEADGRIGSRASFIQHTGSSVNQRRQEAPHAHGIYLDARDRFAYVPDLGIDEVVIYRFDAATGELELNSPAGVKLPPGSGPRHFALHPTKPLAWSLNELLSTVTALEVNPTTGALTAGITVSTLPAGFVGGNSTAEIFVHPTGRFLYASNRGHDSIAVFTIDETSGALSLVQHQPISGKTPRSFALDPTGRWLLAAAQGSDVVNVFRVDPASGRLATKPASVAVPVPVCLVFRAH
ncbi:MAG TPA: lactonase family protein, partial [Verrucomicrobiae bacterium]|nr:lactonase family protein [Verrucomicrobiae bacterium]